jgi:hypothetical protein
VPEPAQVADRTELRRVLLRRPWMLETDAAEWVVSAESVSCGLRYLRFLSAPADYGVHDGGAVRWRDGQAMAVMSPSSK